MKGFQRLGRAGRVLVGVAVAGAIFGIASAVQASIPDSSGVIHGCYNKKGAGELRVIDPSASKQNSCSKSEAALNWNQTGPAGVKGTTGTTGTTGVTGPSGPSGAAGPDGSHYISRSYGTSGGIAFPAGPFGDFETGCTSGNGGAFTRVFNQSGQTASVWIDTGSGYTYTTMANNTNTDPYLGADIHVKWEMKNSTASMTGELWGHQNADSSCEFSIVYWTGTNS